MINFDLDLVIFIKLIVSIEYQRKFLLTYGKVISVFSDNLPLIILKFKFK